MVRYDLRVLRGDAGSQSFSKKTLIVPYLPAEGLVPAPMNGISPLKIPHYIARTH